MKNLEGKIGLRATILSLILALATTISCNKKEKVFATISEGPKTGIKTENLAPEYNKKALEFKNQEQLDSALFYSQKAIDNSYLKGSEKAGEDYLIRAQIYQHFNKNKEAIEAYKKAIYYYSSEQMTKECIPIYQEMAKIYEKASDQERANECKRLAERFKEYLQLH